MLGELYGEFLLNEDTRLSLGPPRASTRRTSTATTPHDAEHLRAAITVQGLYGGEDGAARVARRRRLLRRDQGAQLRRVRLDVARTPVRRRRRARRVCAAAPTTRRGDFSLGAIDYYSDDIINIFYTEAKYGIPLAEKLKLQFAAAVLRPGQRRRRPAARRRLLVRPVGRQGRAGVRAARCSPRPTPAPAATPTCRTPGAAIPGYTSVQVEDFNRDGEDALDAARRLQLPSRSRASASTRCTSTAPIPTIADRVRQGRVRLQPAVDAVPDGVLKGLMMRLRYAHVSQDDPADSDLDDLRVHGLLRPALALIPMRPAATVALLG